MANLISKGGARPSPPTQVKPCQYSQITAKFKADTDTGIGISAAVNTEVVTT